jgi:hypothetical protein
LSRIEVKRGSTRTTIGDDWDLDRVRKQKLLENV